MSRDNSTFSVNEYQEGTSRTANQNCEELLELEDEELNKALLQLNWALGLAGEAGEFADLIKKKIFHGHDVPKEKIEKELGDVQWYLSENCNIHDLNLKTDVMIKNLEKLGERYPDGFDKEESQNRDD